MSKYRVELDTATVTMDELLGPKRRWRHCGALPIEIQPGGTGGPCLCGHIAPPAASIGVTLAELRTFVPCPDCVRIARAQGILWP